VANGDRPLDGALLGSVVGRATGLLMLSPGPLSSTAAGTAHANGLSGRLDQLILLEAVTVAVPPGGGPGRDLEGCPPVSAARNVLAFTTGNDTRNGTPAPT